MKTTGYAAIAQDKPLTPYAFERRALRSNDIAIEILYVGVCHTDLHYAKNAWGVTQYPLVPGHEIIGRVLEAGRDVTRHAPGDVVAVGQRRDDAGSVGVRRDHRHRADQT